MRDYRHKFCRMADEMAVSSSAKKIFLKSGGELADSPLSIVRPSSQGLGHHK
jgi:hypothetical protein